MKKVFFLLVLLACSFSVFAQSKWTHRELSLEEILKESKADLVFVGSVESSYMRFLPEGKGDSTIANFKITTLLRGDLRSESISLIYPGHIGFGEGDVIQFATSNARRVDDKGLTGCPNSRCFYTLVEWYLPYSKANEDRVLKALKRKINEASSRNR